MSLQDIFYLIAIIFMGTIILFNIILIVLLVLVKQRIIALSQSLENTIGLMRDMVTHPAETAEAIGGALIGKAINKASRFLKTKKED